MTDAAARRASSLNLRKGEKIVAALSLTVLACALIALARGGERVAELPFAVLVHLATIVPAVAIGCYVLLRPKGLPLHRALGWAFAVLMIATAISTWWIQISSPGHFSVIHLFSILTLVSVPRLIWMARTHRVDRHRRAVFGLMLGALVLAGFFTFTPGRVFGDWLFGL